jgi:hypothetical protein
VSKKLSRHYAAPVRSYYPNRSSWGSGRYCLLVIDGYTITGISARGKTSLNHGYTLTIIDCADGSEVDRDMFQATPDSEKVRLRRGRMCDRVDEMNRRDLAYERSVAHV